MYVYSNLRKATGRHGRDEIVGHHDVLELLDHCCVLFFCIPFSSFCNIVLIVKYFVLFQSAVSECQHPVRRLLAI